MRRFVNFFDIKAYQILVKRKEKRYVSFIEAYSKILKNKTKIKLPKRF